MKQGEKEDKDESVPRTKSHAFQRFWFGRNYGPRLVFISICGFTFQRLSYLTFGGPQFTYLDVATFLGTTVFWWFQEHWIHGHLLHSDFDWVGKRIHKDHHEKPYHHISIDPPAILMGWLLSVHVFLRIMLPLPLALTATIAYALAGLRYEWTHYIVHTKVKPLSRSMLSIRANHMRHHFLNDDYWLGFSVLFVDQLFETSPDVEKVRKKNMNLKRTSKEKQHEN